MAKSPSNLQDTFLGHLVDNHVPVTLFLVNGIRQQGLLIAHDAFSVQIIREGTVQVIYKKAIATIVPNQPISLYTPEEPTNGERRPKPAR